MKKKLLEYYQHVRETTESLCNSLHVEDYIIQGMEDVSPPKWHLAHTTWFFETFILEKYFKNYVPFNPLFNYLYNSYYQGIGVPYPRSQRGLLSRPSIEVVYEYRAHIDNKLVSLLNNNDPYLSKLIILGLEHEQQHQELLLMDIKYNFSLQPDYPIYQSEIISSKDISPLTFIPVKGGLVTIGYQGESFCFDNELPPHSVFLNPYLIANRLVTNGEFLEFIEDGGYKKANYWLSDGWDWIKLHNIQHPLYWRFDDKKYKQFTLSGLLPLNFYEPVSHLSFFEADAFARWRNCRLPTEEEWENYVLSDSSAKEKLFFGDLWEWTSSAYQPYPGFKPVIGTLGEYNGKFMNNQRVLRGGSFATPDQHFRISYRNFFQPDKRWHFCGMRLAADQ